MSDVKASVTLGVQAEIENLQQIRQQLQDALQHINPGTKTYSSLNKMLQKTAQALQQLAIDSEKPFNKQSQLDSFRNKFLDISNALNLVSKELQNIDFSELNLTEEQKNYFSDLANQITEMENRINNISVDKLTELAKKSTIAASAFEKFGVNIGTDSVESGLKKLEERIDSITEKLVELRSQRSEKQLELLGTKSFSKKNVNILQKALNASTKEDQLKILDGTGLVKTDANGKKRLANANSQEAQKFLATLGLDKKTLDLIRKEGLAAFLEKKQFKQELQKKLEGSELRVAKKGSELSTEIKDIDNDIKNLETDRTLAKTAAAKLTKIDYSQEKKDLENGVINEDGTVAVKGLKQLKQGYEEAKQEAVKNSEATRQAAQAQQELGENAENGGKKIDQESDSLNHLTERAEKLNTIKNAIANWMGFYQVLNLIRNGVRYVIEDIRGLDKVMTEIAVVTNMTQKDLWAQMNTYQAIAREYAVSTQGVYQVSQIYYQQGGLNI